MVVVAIYSNSCCIIGVDKDNDYYYRIYIKNDTDDSLKLLTGERPIVDSFFIACDSAIKYFSIGVDNNQDVIKDVLFNGGYVPFKTRARIYRNDTFLVDWLGPVEDKGDTHHFYNYNSWESWIVEEERENDSGIGIVQFTITDDDLK